MDKSSYVVRIQQWVKIIQEANSSGLSKREWCRQNGIPVRKFYYWYKKAREYMLDQKPGNTSSPDVSTQISTSMAPVFYEVKQPARFPERPSGFPADQTGSFLPEAVIRYEGFGIFVSSSISEKTLSMILSVICHA